MSYHVALQVGRFHDLFALFTFCALFHSHPVFNILVVGETFLGEEPQAAYVAVVSEVLQGQLGQVRIQRPGPPPSTGACRLPSLNTPLTHPSLTRSPRPFKTLNRTGRKWQFSSRTLMTLILILLE